MTKQHFLKLLEFNNWANGQIFQAVQQLTPEQLTAPIPISHGNAYDLVRHMLDTEWSWRLFASGGAGQKYLWEVEDVPDLATLIAFWPGEYTRQIEFVQSKSEADLDRSVDYGTAQGGSPHYMTIWQILTHMVIHATQHRTELNAYLET